MTNVQSLAMARGRIKPIATPKEATWETDVNSSGAARSASVC
jgi:hypothetical protein